MKQKGNKMFTTIITISVCFFPKLLIRKWCIQFTLDCLKVDFPYILYLEIVFKEIKYKIIQKCLRIKSCYHF